MRRNVLLAVTLLSFAVSVRGEDLSRYKTADELWQHIQELKQPGPVSDHAQYVGQLEGLRAAMLEFESRFPRDPRRWDVKLGRMQVESTRAEIDNRRPDNAAALQLAKEIVAAADASAETRTDAKFLAAQIHMEALDSPGASIDANARTAVEADIAEFRMNYPDEPRTASIQLELAQFLKLCDPDAALSILHDLKDSKNVQVAATAQQQLITMDALRKLNKGPLGLRFKAVDGTDVDLAKLRGKVVLVDFWATWCGPCRMEIPNVVAAYNQFHKDGFEIVGISLDQSKEKLLGFTKQAGMTWPQYFDGKLWANDISTRYGINAIPTAWLVDKKGFVRSTETRGAALTRQVKTLLAE
jgi:thiol-disulfide isomerase/thioredoxin